MAAAFALATGGTTWIATPAQRAATASMEHTPAPGAAVNAPTPSSAAQGMSASHMALTPLPAPPSSEGSGRPSSPGTLTNASLAMPALGRRRPVLLWGLGAGVFTLVLVVGLLVVRRGSARNTAEREATTATPSAVTETAAAAAPTEPGDAPSPPADAPVAVAEPAATVAAAPAAPLPAPKAEAKAVNSLSGSASGPSVNSLSGSASGPSTKSPKPEASSTARPAPKPTAATTAQPAAPKKKPNFGY